VSAPTGLEPVADLFLELADDELAGYIRGDLADVSPRELAEQLREAERVLAGLVVMGEALGMATYMVLADAHRRAREARRRAEAAL
jgi:hypothetical protein